MIKKCECSTPVRLKLELNPSRDFLHISETVCSSKKSSEKSAYQGGTEVGLEYFTSQLTLSS